MPRADDEWALFLDVDGTLLDFASHPEGVHVDARLHDDLASLRERLRGALALLSGRTLAQLDELFDWRRHAAAGLHGAQLRLADGHSFEDDGEARVTALHALAESRIAGTPGVLLEDKHQALALHYRNAPAEREFVEQLAQELQQRAGSDFTLQHGNHVIELKPANTDKGRALAALLASEPFAGRQPWMLGDDLTDEHAFEEVNGCGGVSVIVGARRPTHANFALDDPRAVRAWLRGLAGCSS
ncbi:MAG TPA: trehalose-phosphatase [Rhodanobacteraceae bacterium]|nr:trehalose-phosphatase [Rhodanobacteraceae bacterium]